MPSGTNKGNKRHKDWEGGHKTAFGLRGHNHLCRKSERTEKLLELISDYSKAVGYKANIQNLMAFLHTNNEQRQFEIKTTKPFISAATKMQYFCINLKNTYVQDLCKEIYKPLVNEIKKN